MKFSWIRDISAVGFALFFTTHAQQPASSPEHPRLTTWECTISGGCTPHETSVVVDWDSHYIHEANGITPCLSLSGVDRTLCPNGTACARNCVIEPANYTNYGIVTSHDTITLSKYTRGDGSPRKGEPRVYLLGPDGDYMSLQLLGRELSFDVDVSALPCSENGNLYLSEMDMTGGRSEHNPGGARFGSGYCNAQCPVLNWVNGTLNENERGACCNEMDIFEGNAYATHYAAHPCVADECASAGCIFNPYMAGSRNFWGPGMEVDTAKPLTIITQFVTDDNTTSGMLVQIRRMYIQDGKVIPNVPAARDDGSCLHADNFSSSVGLSPIAQALARGMVMVLSLWSDPEHGMQWLDGGDAGPCDYWDDAAETQQPDPYLVFSNVRWGDIGSTYRHKIGFASSVSYKDEL
ncbi:putative endoglucanase [Aspergillus ibericus CBS 121593]|uniref:Glucanase n=1 Tax=Aspergillus ibericus CBS 121593 TaxID=1448316 RepID=A0A395H425_9EURO|nr:putative endoglucanase [Aspergillus ibericus CBS 121593]RAL02632.1 putative endoglucanase [Aspergillus ibericus CBS 121593]